MAAPGQNLITREQMDIQHFKKILAGEDIHLAVGFDYAPCSWGPGCNLSVRKDAVDFVGGFDEKFRGNAIGEDAEFCHRIQKRGGTIYYSARAALVHLQTTSGGCRTETGTEYVKMFTYNSNYFWRAINGGLSVRMRANWRIYRQFVVNKRNITQFNLKTLVSLHREFLIGAYLGLRQPLSKFTSSAGKKTP